MQLTRFTDYATRILLFLSVRREDTVSVNFMADHYGISRNHLAKVAQELVARGYLTPVRGRHGGMRLAKPPEDINLGALVIELEPNIELVDCVGCLISPVCGIPKPLAEATTAFVNALSKYSFADLVRLSPGVDQLFAV